jgi:hypothetical protein
MLSIRVDVEAALASLQRVRTEQIPFALSLAINRCAFQSRENLISRVQSLYHFKTGTAWVRGSNSARTGWFVVEPGTKANLAAVVSTNPQHTYSYLFKDSGLSGVRYARRGYLAVPLGRLQEIAIPADLKPKAIMASFGFVVGKSGHQFIAIRSTKQFKGGSGLIATSGRYKGLQLLYMLVPLVKIKGQKVIDMHAIVRDTVQRTFRDAFKAEMAAAIRTAH